MIWGVLPVVLIAGARECCAFGTERATVHTLPPRRTRSRSSFAIMSTLEDTASGTGTGAGADSKSRPKPKVGTGREVETLPSLTGARRTRREQLRSDARLEKARRMLDEFILDPTATFVEDQVPSSGINGLGAAAAAPGVVDGAGTDGKRRPTKAEAKAKGLSPQTPVIYSKNGTEVVLPDSFWYNGNLEGGSGDYVTRWQRGVKVAEPLKKYDPEAAEKLLFRQPNRWVIRNIQIAFPVGWWAAGVVADVLAGGEKGNRKRRSQQLLRTISGLGPAIIKAGQALASRSDLLPSEYLTELQKLQDDVPRFPNQLAFATIEEELGTKFADTFELIGTEPIAAASIGQVYKARLVSNGETVAIKIQRPNCEDTIALDLYVLRWWSKWWNRVAQLLNRDIDFSSIIDDFGELIYREIDYVAEAANAQRFNELYSGVTNVFVPKVYSELTTSKVLTMEWVDGFRLTDDANLDAYGLDRKQLVDALVQCSLRQILENGFFHGE